MAHMDGFEAESYLKSGANELRVLEYNVCGHSFGINILKVKKIVSHVNQFMAMPESHDSVRGVFEDRGTVVPLIDLAYFLGIPRVDDKPPQKVIITEFFEMQNGFWVDRIDWIHHFRWEDVIDAEGILHGFDQKYVIGIVKPTEEKMILLLDYENIILDICPQLRTDANTRFERANVTGEGRKVLVAEDSPAIRNMLVTEFSEVGFDVEQARDGLEAKELFERADPPFDLVISDVEMPRMDGLALTVAIRSNGERKDTPVIVYSSIGDIGMKTRANFLKANAHITKLNFEELLGEVEKLTSSSRQTIEVTETATDEPQMLAPEEPEVANETAQAEPEQAQEPEPSEPEIKAESNIEAEPETAAEEEKPEQKKEAKAKSEIKSKSKEKSATKAKANTATKKKPTKSKKGTAKNKSSKKTVNA